MTSPQSQGPSRVRTSVDLRNLIRVGERPGFLDYLVALWDYRHFVLYNARANVQSKNSEDKLGSIWLILSPLLNGLTFLLIFGLLLGAGRGVENYIGYLIIGVFLFQLSGRSISGGARAIRTNRKLVQSFDFPRASLLLALNLRELIGSVPVVLAMYVLILLSPPTEPITPLWLLVIPAILLQVILNAGIGLILARLVVRLNDLVNLIPFAMRILMYGSCVMFPLSLFDRFPTVQRLIEFNPLYQVFNIVRQSVLYATFPAWQSWAILALWALVMFSAGMVFFWRYEEVYGRDK